MLKLAAKLGELDQVLHFDAPRVGRPSFAFYDFETYEKLVAAARREGPRHLVLVLLAGDAGLRMGELLALEAGDVDRKTRHLVVRRSEWRKQVSLPKGGHPRSVPMTVELAAALEQLQLAGGRVLRRVDGGRLTYQGARTLMCQVQRRAGMKVDGRVHVLRHTFCSHLAMRGAAAIAIRDVAGHVHSSTTERYMHLAPAERIRTIGLLDEARLNAGAVAARESL
jgi:integrase